MADDIEIEVSVELEKALANLKKLEDQIKSTKASVDQQLSPSVDNMGTKITGAGNRISGFGQKIRDNISGETALAFTALSAGVTSFTKNCVTSAINSESAWSRFGALVNQNGGNWSEQSAKVKKWATDFSNSMGYATSDTREAAATFLQLGMNVSQMQTAMKATAGVAARAGITEAEASTIVANALMGKGRQLEKVTGLRLDDYKTADGQIDRERLLNDLYNQNTDAIRSHAKTTEAQINRINNSWAKFKTGIGQALLPVITMIADFVEKLVNGFNSIEGPLKPFIAGIIAVVAVVSGLIGVLGIVAPILINVGTLISKVGKLYQGLKLAKGIGDSWKSFKDKIDGVKNAVSNLKLGNKVQSVKSAVLNSWTVLKSNIDKARLAISKFELRQKLATIAQKAHTLATTVWNGITKVATTVQAAFNAVMAANPIYLVVIAVLALVAVLTYLYFNNEQVRNSINALGDYLKGVFLPIWDALSKAISGVVNWFQEVFSGSKSLTDALGDVVNAILQFTGLDAVVQVLQDLWASVGPAAQGIWDAFTSSLSGLGQWLWNTLSDIPRIIGEALSGLGASLVPGGGLVEGIMGIIAPIPTLLYGKFMEFAPQILPAVNQFITDVVNGFNDFGNQIMQRISESLSGLGNYVMQTISSIPQMISNGLASLGSIVFPDGFVNGIIEKVTMIPNMIYQNIITWGPQVIPAVTQFIDGIIQGFMGIGQRIVQFFFDIPMLLVQTFMNILVNIQTWFVQAGAQIGILIQMLIQTVTMQFWQLVMNVGQIFQNILMTIWNVLTNGAMIAGTLAGNLKTAVTTVWNTIIGSASSIFNNIVNAIKNKLVQAVNTAKQKAKEIVTGFVNKIKELPGKVGTEIANLATTIKNKLVEAGKRAFEGARNLVAQFLAGMGIHSPGIIQRMTAIEMSSLPGIITNNALLAAKATMNMAKGIVGAWKDNMSTLQIGDIETGNIPSIESLSTDLQTNMKLNTIPLIQGIHPMNNPVETAIMGMTFPQMGTRNSIMQSYQNSKNDVNKTLIIEEMNLELGNLTVEQAKRVVFTAIQDVIEGVPL